MVIKIDGEIGWSVTAREIKRLLDEAKGDITIEISSPGGSVYQGVSIFNAIRQYDKGEVTTIVTSLAASMASYIALAGDKIKAFDNAVYMIHNASLYSWGDHRALRKSASIVESLSKLLAKEYVAKTGKTEKEINELMNEETYYFGDEILTNGFIDEIITSNSDDDEDTSKALASENVKACISAYREHFENEDKEQVAAIISQCQGNCNNTKMVGTNPSNKEQIENSKQENSMRKYTKEEFEALEQEHSTALKDGSSEATATERKRVSGIIALDGSQDVKMKAIEDGATVGDTAIALNKSNSEATAKLKKDFEDGASALEGNEVPENTEVTAEQKAEADVDAALNKV